MADPGGTNALGIVANVPLASEQAVAAVRPPVRAESYSCRTTNEMHQPHRGSFAQNRAIGAVWHEGGGLSRAAPIRQGVISGQAAQRL